MGLQRGVHAVVRRHPVLQVLEAAVAEEDEGVLLRVQHHHRLAVGGPPVGGVADILLQEGVVVAHCDVVTVVAVVSPHVSPVLHINTEAVPLPVPGTRGRTLACRSAIEEQKLEEMTSTLIDDHVEIVDNDK